MGWLNLLLRAASLALPAQYRRRWLEESSAVLYDVRGWRRWWYAVDTALKVPLLAREYQRGPVLPPRWLTLVAGATLAGTPILLVGGFYVTVLVGLDVAGAETVLLVLMALLPTVAARSFLLATRRGGGAVRYAGAALVTAVVAVGAVAPYRAAVADSIDWTVLSTALVGAWLGVVNLRILRRRTGAADQAVLGVMTGVPLVLLPVISLMAGDQARFHVIGAYAWIGAIWTIPVLGFWCLMAGLRMLLGRLDLLVDSDAGGTDRSVEVGG